MSRFIACCFPFLLSSLFFPTPPCFLIFDAPPSRHADTRQEHDHSCSRLPRECGLSFFFFAAILIFYLFWEHPKTRELFLFLRPPLCQRLSVVDIAQTVVERTRFLGFLSCLKRPHTRPCCRYRRLPLFFPFPLKTSSLFFFFSFLSSHLLFGP